jgi:hypothetical protein
MAVFWGVAPFSLVDIDSLLEELTAIFTVVAVRI